MYSNYLLGKRYRNPPDFSRIIISHYHVFLLPPAYKSHPIHHPEATHRHSEDLLYVQYIQELFLYSLFIIKTKAPANV